MLEGKWISHLLFNLEEKATFRLACNGKDWKVLALSINREVKPMSKRQVSDEIFEYPVVDVEVIH